MIREESIMTDNTNEFGNEDILNADGDQIKADNVETLSHKSNEEDFKAVFETVK